MNETEAAWAAGLFEGEGTIVNTAKNSVAVTIFMTDLDVLERLHALSEVGTLTGPYQDKRRESGKPIWKWTISRGSDADSFLREIRPFMGARRTRRIDEALERLSGQRGRERCSKGHDNWRTNTNGTRYCRDCANEAQRRRRAYEESLLAPRLPAPPRIKPEPRVRQPVEIRHGSVSAYAYHKCRCDICVEGKRKKDREYYEKNAEKVKARVAQYKERSVVPSPVET